MCYNGAGVVRATSRYTYDAAGRVLSVSVPQVNYSETTAYNNAYRDTDGKLYAQTQKTVAGDADAPSLVTVTRADALGRVCKEYLAGVLATSTVYDKLGNKTSQTDAAANTTTFVCDYAGRVLSTTRRVGGAAQTTSTVYDALGSKTETTDSAGAKTLYVYDAAGRLLKQTAPFDTRSAVSKYTYDAAGNLTWQRVLCQQPGGADAWRQTRYIYDARARQTEVYLYEDDALQKWACTRTVYDNVGNNLETQTGITQSATDYTAVRYSYNRFGNVLSITDALGQAEAYTYDATGRLLTKTDRNGSVTRFTHDAQGRLLKEEVTATDERGALTSTRECAYTRTGQKKTDTAKETENGVAGLALTTQYRYNERGQLANQQDPGGIEKQLTWDVRGNRESLVLLKSGTVQISLFYQYDEAGRLLRVRQANASGAILAEYAYDANGNRTRLTNPATGMETTYAYNKGNLVTALTNKQGAATLSSFAYTYCMDGNQATKTGTEGNVNYIYDRLGRLTEENDDKWNRIQYTYDRFHNRQKMAVTPNGQQLDKAYTTEYQYDKNNRLLKETKTGEEGIETTHYRYDKNGSQLYKEWEGLSPDGKNLPKSQVSFIKENKADGTAILDMRQYNGFGQLIRVWRDALDIRYRYRPDKLRHQKTVKSPFTNTKTETLYQWDGQNMVMETNAATGSVKARYLRGANLIAQQIDSQVHYYTHNAHGDVVQRVNQGGGATPKYQYDAFGNQREPEKNDPNPFRYCGEYWDADLGEVYLRARMYDPANGRFTQDDPARSGVNWYTYCNNSPIQFVDPSGLAYKNNSKNISGNNSGFKSPKSTGGGAIQQAIQQIVHTVTKAVAAAVHVFNQVRQNLQEYWRVQNAISNGAIAVPQTAMQSPLFSNMLFNEDNCIEVPHGRYGYVRGGGTVRHTGLDISTLGDPTVHSTVSGRVWRVVETEPGESSDLTWQWGAYIVIEDDDGNFHLFAHCENNSFQGLQVGDRVTAGQPIATMGMTGNANTAQYDTGQGPHVHYEVRAGSFTAGADVDPSQWAGMPSNPATPNVGGMVGSWYMP